MARTPSETKPNFHTFRNFKTFSEVTKIFLRALGRPQKQIVISKITNFLNQDDFVPFSADLWIKYAITSG